MKALAALALLSLVLALAPAAQAQSGAAPASDAERAITTGKAGVAAYEGGNWAEALEHFRQAEALYHSPVFALFAARSLRQLGQLLEARAALQKLAIESIAPTAPAPWQKVPADARLELAELGAEIPSVTLVVHETGTVITLDGSAVTAGAPIELNPGPHRARIASGSRQREVEFRVAARSHEQIELSLNEPEVPRALIDPPLTRRPAPALPPPPRSPAHGALYLPGWALVGTGAAAVVAGGIVGALALDKRASLEDSRDAKLRADSCRQQTCLTSQRAAVETHFAPAHRLAVASDVLWISGAVVALTGVTLLLLDKPAREAPSAALHLYPGGGTFEARF